MARPAGVLVSRPCGAGLCDRRLGLVRMWMSGGSTTVRRRLWFGAGLPGATCPKAVSKRMDVSLQSRAYLRKLVGQDGDLVGRRWLGQQFARFRHQRRGDLAIEMRVAASLVVEGIENRERRWAFLNGEPCNSARLGIHQRQRRFQELCDFLFFAGFGLKGNVQRNLGHHSLLQWCLTRAVRMPPASGVSRLMIYGQSQFR